MNYEIKGGNFPVVECTLNNGEKIVTESGCMTWMDPSIKMEATSNGGFGKVFERFLTQEKIFQNIYTSTKDGSKITLGTCVPGSIAAIKLENGQSIVCQKSSFLAAYGNVELSIFFNKKLGAGLFGGEGFIMQKIVGDGIVFLEIDGSSMEYELAEGQEMLISTGYLVYMDETCSIDIRSVGSVKNAFLGGEGIFNTVITGPGKVVVQTMPLSHLAVSLVPYLPHNTNSN